MQKQKVHHHIIIMNWFSGNIAEAVTLSKKQNSVFVVFVEGMLIVMMWNKCQLITYVSIINVIFSGEDEQSANLSACIDTEQVRSVLESKAFVAIRIKSTTESYTQFAEICKILRISANFILSFYFYLLYIVFYQINSFHCHRYFSSATMVAH